MKILTALLVIALSVLAGCKAPTSPNQVVVSIEDPNNIGKATQAGVQIAATAFLANNPSYKDELVAAANALVAIGNANPATLTGSDISAVLAKTKLSDKVKAEAAAYATSAMSIFVSNFNTQFPQLKPDYTIYIYAVANGLYMATGNPNSVVPLPKIQWPPVAP